MNKREAIGWLLTIFYKCKHELTYSERDAIQLAINELEKSIARDGVNIKE